MFRSQFDSKMRTSPRPAPLSVSKSLMSSCEDMEKAKMLAEIKETVDALKAAGIKATVVVEAEM